MLRLKPIPVLSEISKMRSGRGDRSGKDIWHSSKTRVFPRFPSNTQMGAAGPAASPESSAIWASEMLLANGLWRPNTPSRKIK